MRFLPVLNDPFQEGAQRFVLRIQNRAVGFQLRDPQRQVRPSLLNFFD